VGTRSTIGLRVAAIAAWGGFIIAMATWSGTDVALATAAVATVVVGCLVGRWWVLLVPIVPGVLLAVGTLLADPEGFQDNSPGFWAAYIAVATIAFVSLMALGVGINRSVASFRVRR
jgi:hypothetical protein